MISGEMPGWNINVIRFEKEESFFAAIGDGKMNDVTMSSLIN